MSNFREIQQIRRDHQRSGGHFFEKETMEFFDSRIEPYPVSRTNDRHNRRFFITSEVPWGLSERRFFVRYATTSPVDGETTIHTFYGANAPLGYETMDDAASAITTLFDLALDVGWETVVDMESLR